MKKLIYIISVIALAAAVQACDYTDLEPTDMVDQDTAFKDVEGVYKATIGAYGRMSLRRTLAVAEYIADDVMQGGQAGGAGTDLTSWVYSASSSEASTLWSSNYSLINQCNRILEFGPNVTPATTAEAETLEDCLGTAYFFRAYAHFELLRFFADFNNENKSGIPYVSHWHILGMPERDKVGETFDQIMYDLERAYDMIKVDAPSDVAFVSKVAVNALRARVALYRKQYTLALVFAQDVLNKVPMAQMASVEDVWTDASNAGIIFKLPRVTGQDRIGGLFVGQDNSSVFVPTSAYMSCYTSDDVRASVFFGQGPDRSGNTVDVVMKWYGSSSNIGLCDEKVFRSEEMKLIEAEAQFHLGNNAEANQALNELRSIRIEGWVAATYPDASLPDQLLLERRRELSFEGHRLFDLRRYNRDLVRGSSVLEANNYRMILPIPQGEIDANENLKDDQNPGY
ncbi:MAG: RagB/SusD family nutrient uptake outer membrane protein [Alistipes sp.]|nr:RagB/SusD family nutrient uptake outer membrane protein [Alistipes sp.]